jgi:hypothetical protein
MTSPSFIPVVLLALLAVVAGGCGGGEADSPTPRADGDGPVSTTEQSSGSPPADVAAAGCVLTVEYQGNTYLERQVVAVPREAGRLGTGVIPDCNDTGGEPGPGEEIQLTALEGVSPDVAVHWSGRPEAVLVREGFENRPPPPLRREAPTCDPDDEPIRLAGPWYGIWGRGNLEEVDLTAPYRIKLFVAKSSASRYERAFLLVSVPAGLERTLTRNDLRWLWDGTIELTARCRDRLHVAESVAAHPPG